MSMRALLPTFSALLLILCAAALGCQPTLPDRFGDGGGSTSEAQQPHAVIEPEAPLDAAPRVVRVRIVPAAGATADAARVLFVRGHVGAGHIRQVVNDSVSQALTERVVPAITWTEEDGSVVLAPGEVLEPGETYGVLSADPPLGIDLRIDTGDPVPVLAQVWPPAGADAAGGFAIFCGEREIAAVPTPLAEVVLAPGDVAATMALGVADGIGSSCLRLDAIDLTAVTALETAGDGPVQVVPPALVILPDGSPARLDPKPIALTAGRPSSAVVPLACAPTEVVFGPGCARVADDRIFVFTPETPLFWAVRSRAAGGDSIHVTSANEPWVLHGLTPGTPADITFVAVDVLGRAPVHVLEVVTAAPMAHVEISEVLANPVGSEPDQEWVELLNDGLADADLSGYVLADIGGETALPAATLLPGELALVVNETFLEDDELDPSPAKGTLLLRVATLGKAGLKNDGEPLRLRAADGTVVSRFPAAPKAKAGQSVGRVAPGAPDGAAASFAVMAPTPGAPNALSSSGLP